MLRRMLPLLKLTPEFHARVWGGTQLKKSEPPTGEAWIVHESNFVDGGEFDGLRLAEVVARHPEALLGSAPFAQTGDRFPLLIKLLDCADWLSVQVHPDDALAVELEGPGHFGKTEAWYFLNAEPEARVISGVAPGVSPELVAQAIREGGILDVCHFENVAAGDSIMMPARTMHALGPGLFLYEVQQTSDITYRVWDWDRPLTAGRSLHIEQSVTATDPAGIAETHAAVPYAYGYHDILSSAYFHLARYDLAGEPLFGDTRGESFHIVTAIDGAVSVTTDHAQATLGQYETLIIPAETHAYHLQAGKKGEALVARVPA